MKKKRPQLFSNWVLFGTIGNRNMSVNMFPMRLCHFFAFCFLVLVTAEARQTSFPQVMIGKRMFPIFLIIKKIVSMFD